VKSVFKDSEFTVQKKDIREGISEFTINSRDYTPSVSSPGDLVSSCLIFVINNGILTIKEFNHYDKIDFGDKLLKLIDELARIVDDVKSIEFSDDLSVPICGGHEFIFLFQIDIVTTGQSWFNRHGYHSDERDTHYNLNRKYINTTPISRLFNDLKYDELKLYEEANRIFPAKDNETVKEYFTRLVDKVRPYDTTYIRGDIYRCNTVILLKKLLYVLFNDKQHLKYKQMLQKNIKPNAGGGKRRSIKRKRNNKHKQSIKRKRSIKRN
jgi:hypothetical protein